MKGNYLAVDKRALPEVYEKVVDTKTLLRQKKVKDITEATKTVGISRSVYYKYKDYVFEFSESTQGKKVTVNFIIEDRKGVLSCVLNYISEAGGSIVTINQGIPMNGSANLSLTIDISNTDIDIKNLLEGFSKLDYIEKVDLIAME